MQIHRQPGVQDARLRARGVNRAWRVLDRVLARSTPLSLLLVAVTLALSFAALGAIFYGLSAEHAAERVAPMAP